MKCGVYSSLGCLMRHFFAAFSIQATLTIALLTGTNHAYAQSGLDPLWPIVQRPRANARTISLR